MPWTCRPAGKPCWNCWPITAAGPITRLPWYLTAGSTAIFKEGRDRHQGILVIYSRRGERADEVIKRLLHQERERALVVTSDREIQVCAEQAKAAWINASQFESSHLHDPSGAADPDAGADLSARGTHKKGPARRLSKRLRQRQQRLKKL